MPDRITLAEVLQAYDSDVAMRLLGPLAVRYILQNRAALERMDLEQQVRAACGAGELVPIAWVHNDSRRPFFDTDKELVVVGRDWRPDLCAKCHHTKADHVYGHGCTSRVSEGRSGTGPECECGEWTGVESK